MPFTARHQQYLEAMGLVPWVSRAEQAEAVEPPTMSSGAILLENRAVIHAELQGVEALIHGTDSASLLLVFEQTGDSNRLALADSENRLLLDMLRAIGLGEKDVSRCLVAQSLPEEPIRTLLTAVQPNHKAVLALVGPESDTASDEAEASEVAIDDLMVPVWELPHPSWIQAQPALKRRAWNILKAVKAVLPESVDP